MTDIKKNLESYKIYANLNKIIIELWTNNISSDTFTEFIKKTRSFRKGSKRDSLTFLKIKKY